MRMFTHKVAGYSLFYGLVTFANLFESCAIIINYYKI